MADINALIRNPIVLGGAAVVVVAGALVGGYFLGRGGGSGGSPAAGTTAGQEVANRSVCQASLARVSDFGIVEPGATLASDEATTTNTPNRVVCTAKSGATTYTITVDSPCSDMKDPRCLQLYNVTDSSGATLFRRTKFLDPE